MATFSDEYRAGIHESGGIVRDVNTGMTVKVNPENIPHFEGDRWRNVPDDTPVTHPVATPVVDEKADDKTPAKK